MNTEHNQCYSQANVCDLLGVSVAALAKWRTSAYRDAQDPRYLPAAGPGHTYRPEDVIEFLKRPENEVYANRIRALLAESDPLAPTAPPEHPTAPTGLLNLSPLPETTESAT